MARLFDQSSQPTHVLESLAVFDAAVALERILESNCQPRMMTALLWLTAGLSYRQACSRADLAITRAADLQRTAHRMGLRELHLSRKAERREFLECANRWYP